MVTSWVADEFQTVIKLVPTYLCIKRFCRTAVSQSEKSIHTDQGITVTNREINRIPKIKSSGTPREKTPDANEPHPLSNTYLQLK